MTLRNKIRENREQLEAVLARYGASNPRLFGSVARGDANETSDIDLLVDLHSSTRNSLLQVAGISEELSDLLESRVDVVCDSLLRNSVSATAKAEAVPL
jgi:uncharacterized protein